MVEGVAATTVKVDVQVNGVVLQSSVALKVKLRFTAPPHTNAGSAGIVAIFEEALQPSFTAKPATQVLYADVIAAELIQELNIGSVGQLTVNGVADATVKVDVQITGVVLHSSVTLSVKLKFTAPPHTNAGKAGIIAIFELTLLQPSFTKKPDTQAL